MVIQKVYIYIYYIYLNIATFALQRTNNNLDLSEELLEHSKPNITSLTIPINKLDFNIDNYVERIQREFPTASQDSIEDDSCLNIVNNNEYDYKPRRSLIVTPNKPSSYSVNSVYNYNIYNNIQNENTPYRISRCDNSPLSSTEIESLTPDNNNIDNSKIKCNICRIGNIDQNQLIQCNDCRKYYHTYCEGLRQIPYNNYPNDENIKRLLYVYYYIIYYLD